MGFILFLILFQAPLRDDGMGRCPAMTQFYDGTDGQCHWKDDGSVVKEHGPVLPLPKVPSTTIEVVPDPVSLPDSALIWI